WQLRDRVHSLCAGCGHRDAVALRALHGGAPETRDLSAHDSDSPHCPARKRDEGLQIRSEPPEGGRMRKPRIGRLALAALVALPFLSCAVPPPPAAVPDATRDPARSIAAAAERGDTGIAVQHVAAPAPPPRT